MRHKKFFAFSFAVSALFGVMLAHSYSEGQRLSPVSADTSAVPEISPNEKEITEENSLSIRAVSAATTDNSVAFDVKFSTGVEALADIDGAYNIVGINDTVHEEILAFNAELNEKYPQADKKEAAKVPVEEATKFTGKVHSFGDSKTEIWVPTTISRGDFNKKNTDGERVGSVLYYVEIVEVGGYSLSEKSKCTTLYIPKEIMSIPATAFVEAQVLTDIYCEHESLPEGFEAGWNNGATVHWNQNIYKGKTTNEKLNLSHPSTIDFKDVGKIPGDVKKTNYMIGYYPTDGTQGYPLIVDFIEHTVSGEDINRQLVCEKVEKNLPYDGVGKSIYKFSNVLTFNFEVSKGSTVDLSSVVVHNIVKALKEDKKDEKGETYSVFKPDPNNIFFSSVEKDYNRMNNINEFIKISFKGISRFNGYAAIRSKVDLVNDGLIYKELKEGFYNIYKEDLENGNAVIRFRFTSLSTGKYYLYTSESRESSDRIVCKVQTPIAQFVMLNKQGNNSTFILKEKDVAEGFDARNLQALSLNNVSISIDIVLNGTILTKTVARVSFGSIYFMNGETFTATNLNNVILFSVLGYLAVAALVCTGLYFYMKKKFRNDEFRRVKPKQFIKKSIIYSLTSLAVALAIFFIVLRNTLFANAIVVYNPMDVFIILFGIATVIIVGYYIKNFVVSTKANKTRKRAAKLGLDKDVADDGTK